MKHRTHEEFLVQDLSGHAQLHSMVDNTNCTLDALSNPVRGPCGICTGDQGASRACPYGDYHRIWPGAHRDLSRPRTGMPVMPLGLPYKSRMGPGRTLGMPGQIPYGPQPGPLSGYPQWHKFAKPYPYWHKIWAQIHTLTGINLQKN